MRRRFRLRRSADIERLFKNGKRLQHPLLVMIVGANGLSFSRFGFSASKHLGKAWIRNRTKRLMREAVRLRMARIGPGWDCHFIARPKAAQAGYAEVDRAIEQLLKQAQLLD